jgi:hypothetical protein
VFPQLNRTTKCKQKLQFAFVYSENRRKCQHYTNVWNHISKCYRYEMEILFDHGKTKFCLFFFSSSTATFSSINKHAVRNQGFLLKPPVIFNFASWNLIMCRCTPLQFHTSPDVLQTSFQIFLTTAGHTVASLSDSHSALLSCIWQKKSTSYYIYWRFQGWYFYRRMNWSCCSKFRPES